MATKTAGDNNKWAQDNQSDLEQWLRGHVDGEIATTSHTGSNHGLSEKLGRISDVKIRGKLSEWYDHYRHLI